MKLKIYNRISILFAVFILAGVFSYIFSRSSCAAGLVPCTDDCNLCYLLVGISNIFLYLAGSMLMAAVLLGIVIGGMTFIVSGLFPQALNFAKLAFTVSLKALVIALCGWLAINSIMNVVGYKHPAGGKWWQHDCSGSANTQTASTTSNTSNTSNANSTNNNNSSKSQCDSKDKKLDSIKIQCAEQKEAIADDGAGFYVALDTLSGDETKKTQQLKAIGKYSCNGTTSEEDITSQVEWKASDETQIKVAKGLIQAVKTTLGSSSESAPYVEAKYDDKNSNQAKVYINACPTATAKVEAETGNKFSFSENSLIIPQAHAEPKEGCESCVETTTCHHVKNTNPNGPFIFILARSDSQLGFKSLGCDNPGWNEEDSVEIAKVSLVADNMVDELKYVPDASKIGIYWTSKVLELGEKDENCPDGKLSSYGYIYSGDGPGAFALTSRGLAVYCRNMINEEKVFAHEQIGHILGHLDDEYTEQSANADRFHFTYNCTKDPSCNKWKSKRVINQCIKGCLGEQEYFYRSSENSIMNKQTKANSFNLLSLEIIQYFMEHYPNGPEDLKEQYQLFPWELPTM